jgi:hypothetical protein
MSSGMPAYEAVFDVGAPVRVQALNALKAFRDSWKFHHPLDEAQLAFAGRWATVATIGYYHGGDLLYTLNDVPGIWHEQCLERADGIPA